MPRNAGTGVYEQPAPDVITATTIESAVYNSFVNDVETDLNAPRPIVAGGTGANNATTARDNLDAEVAMTKVVNYDSHVWENGSFWSASDATGEPVDGHRFAGICTIVGDPSHIYIEARDLDDTLNPGLKWVRKKRDGIWQVWTSEQTNNDARYVNVTGDTMSGPLITPVKGNQFGTSGGTLATASVVQADANILLYNSGPNNWAGVGIDLGGAFWIRTGLSGGPRPALWIDPSQNVSVLNEPTTLGHVATKNYVDTTTVSLTGDTMSGSLVCTALNSIYAPAGANVPAVGSVIKVGLVPGNAGIATRATLDSQWHLAFENISGVNVGQITTSATATQFNTSSDARLKEDLKSFDAGNIIDDTNVYDFAWKSTNERSYGIIAQQANEVYPTAVHYNKDQDWWGIDYAKYVPVILQELKALRVRVAELEGKLGVEVKPP